jgi:hypothetical protein
MKVGSFERVASFIGKSPNAASINIEPQAGFLMVEEIGSGHDMMLAEYGVAEEDKNLFLPGAVTMVQGKPVFHITGGLEDASLSDISGNLTLVANHLLRLGFDSRIMLRAYTGAPKALESTIGSLAKDVDFKSIGRGEIKITKISSITDLGERGYLVADRRNNVYDLQEGSVAQARGVDVTNYCYYVRDDEGSIVMYNIKAKHFDTNSDSIKVAEKLRKILKVTWDDDRVIATGDYLTRG